MSRVIVVEDQPNLLRSITAAEFTVEGASTLAEATVPVYAILKDVIHQLQPMAFECSITFLTDNIDASAVVGSDLKLRQVFLDVMENALKFTRSGGTMVVHSEFQCGTMVTVTLPGQAKPQSIKVVGQRMPVSSDQFLESTA